MSGDSSTSQILVLGSLAWEVALTPIGPDKYQRHGAWVGAPIIRKMIREALVELNSEPSSPNVDDEISAANESIEARLLPKDADSEFLKAARGEITAVFKKFPKKSDAKKPTVLRVQTNYTSVSSDTGGLKEYIKGSLDSSIDSDIVVVYDQDPQFHSTLEEALATRSCAREPKPLLVIALADKIHEDSLVTIVEKLSEPRRTIVLATATHLRKWGLNIVEYGSIEQTVHEVGRYSREQPLQTILQNCGHLIILFEETGAIYLRRATDGWLEGSLHFCPNFDRIAQMDVEVYGMSPGRVAIALASVVRQLDAEPKEATSLNLAPAVRLAVAAYNVHFREGFNEKDPFKTMEKALSYERRCDLRSWLENSDKTKREKEFFVSSLDFRLDEEFKEWNRLTNVLSVDREPEVLRQIVKKGVEYAFRVHKNDKSDGLWFPKVWIKCPYLEVGKIKTFDADEIAGFAALAKLIRKYLLDETWKTPLSIAVFGEPGSGKSFGVKELLKSINPDTRDALTFNLAQFDSVVTLTEAFHQVQDRALSSDDVPLVIFDEFDSNFNESPLGWLKYFLAPMQDGVFRGQSGEYRVGRAIFLFAGGTSTSFQHFKNKGEKENFKSAKLTDFVSRLHGFLDVVDINPPKVELSTTEAEPEHRRIQRRVRRAVVLRSLLVRLAGPIMSPGDKGDDDIANIADDVIDAFLNVPRYEHGVRSMESVVRMSRWIDGELIKASLPASPQLDMHAPGFWEREQTTK
jgi:hypothetical protein